MRKVLLSYIHYPISVGRFMKRGLQQIPDVEVFSVGPCQFGHIPWNPRADYSQYQDVPDLELFPKEPHRYPLAEVLAQIDFTPDAIIMVDAGFHLYAGNPDIPIALIGTDPHCLNYWEQSQYANAFFLMQKCYMTKYQVNRPGFSINAQWLPYCYDPATHYWNPDATIDHQVSFVGNVSPDRLKILFDMQGAGIKVEHQHGRLFEEGTEVYNRGLVSWVHSTRDDLPMRFWEGLAYRNLVVTNWVPDLQELVAWGLRRDEHYIAYHKDELETDLIPILAFWSSDSPKAVQVREEIAAAGYIWVQPHTYEERMRRVLRALGLEA